MSHDDLGPLGTYDDLGSLGTYDDLGFRGAYDDYDDDYDDSGLGNLAYLEFFLISQTHDQVRVDSQIHNYRSHNYHNCLTIRFKTWCLWASL